jgi:uncharacterized protein (UPF0335 family)
MGFMYRNAEWLSDEAAKKKLTEQATQINSLSKRVKELKEENKKLTQELHDVYIPLRTLHFDINNLMETINVSHEKYNGNRDILEPVSIDKLYELADKLYDIAYKIALS